MLRFLRIRNLAVIESVDIELADGFTVLTGETGAGKSILVEAVGIAKQSQHESIAAHGCFNHVGDELICVLVGIVKAFSGKLGMAAEVVVGSVVNALHFLPSNRKLILDISGLLGVVRELVLPVRMKTKLFPSDAHVHMPGVSVFTPFFEVVGV